ncbi:MAG: hypothetical protein ACTHOE_05925 [Conexibacter sp.]
MTLVSTFAQLAAELPDPGAPMFPGICAGYGGFVGGVIAWRRGLPLGPLATRGSVAGFGLGFMGWILALAIDRL